MIASGSSAYASIVNYGSDLKNLESFQKFIFEQKKYLPLSSELFKEKGIPVKFPVIFAVKFLSPPKNSLASVA